MLISFPLSPTMVILLTKNHMLAPKPVAANLYSLGTWGTWICAGSFGSLSGAYFILDSFFILDSNSRSIASLTSGGSLSAIVLHKYQYRGYLSIDYSDVHRGRKASRLSLQVSDMYNHEL
jgi:hypothetical protein